MGDKCIIVNMADPKFTGRKRQQKLYRHHTGYPGGLKEFTFKTVNEKNPERVLIEAVMGMLPKNSLRKELVRKYVTIYTGPYHNFDILPQFTEPLPTDINEEMGFTNVDKDNYKIQFSSSKEIPEEFKHLELDLDDTIDVPLTARKKTHVNPRYNLKLAYAVKQSWRNQTKYKEHR